MTDTAPHGIVTPEAVVLEFDTAGAGSRGVGELLDVLVQLTALIVLLIIVSAGFGFVGSVAPASAWIAIIVFLLISFLVFFGYPIAMETLWNGRTLGKAAMGVRVVTIEGGPIRFRHAAIRGIIGFVEIWLTFGLVALLAIIFSKRNQRLGDMVAGTIVLRERNASKRSVAVTFPPPHGLEAYVDTLDVTTITPEEYGVIRSFLMRVFELAPAARATIAVRLANPVAVQLHHTPPPDLNPELFLACIAAAYQRRYGGPTAPVSGAWGAAPGSGPDGYPGSGYPGSGYPGSGSPGSGYPGGGYPGSGYPGSGYPGYPGSPGSGYPGSGYPGSPGSGSPGSPGSGYPGSGSPGSGLRH